MHCSAQYFALPSPGQYLSHMHTLQDKGLGYGLVVYQPDLPILLGVNDLETVDSKSAVSRHFVG
jgi:hypothetical protein